MSFRIPVVEVIVGRRVSIEEDNVCSKRLFAALWSLNCFQPASHGLNLLRYVEWPEEFATVFSGPLSRNIGLTSTVYITLLHLPGGQTRNFPAAVDCCRAFPQVRTPPLRSKPS